MHKIFLRKVHFHPSIRWMIVLISLILMLTILVACQTQTTNPSSQQNANADQTSSPNLQSPGILFWSDRSGEIAWYFMKPDGSNPQKLTFPQLPTGYKIKSLKYLEQLKAFVVNLADAQDATELYIMDAQGKIISQLTHNTLNVGEFDYDPIHRRFAYVCIQFDTDICLVNADGSGFQNLNKSNTKESEPHWFPDGNKILFTSDIGGVPSLFTIKPDGTDLADFSKTTHIESGASFSPDGSLIVMQSQRDGMWNIFTIKPDGSSPTNIARDPSPEYGPVWSPDSQYVVFRSLRENADDLYIVKRDGTGLKRLTNSPSGAESAYSFSADSQYVLFTQDNNGQGDVYMVKIDGTGLTDLTSNPAMDSGGQWISK